MQTLVLYALTEISEVVYVLFVYVIDILSAVSKILLLWPRGVNYRKLTIISGYANLMCDLFQSGPEDVSAAGRPALQGFA